MPLPVSNLLYIVSCLFAGICSLFVLAEPAYADTPGKSIIIVVETTQGSFTLRLYPKLAPKNVQQLVTLTERKFYDGVPFHRVIEGFMAQTGDPTGTGTGKSDLPDIPAEFSDRPFKRGTIGMARAQDPNSANSQFFICFAEAVALKGQYTVVGDVIEGMKVVDKLKKGDPARNGQVENPDKILTMRIKQ